jgi:chitinase
MKKIRQTIKEFRTENNMIIIRCNKYYLHFDIINGSIDFNFIDEQNNIIGLNCLDVDDDIIIYFKDKNTVHGNMIIKPIKIIKILKYEFNNDSSQDNSSEIDI